MNSPRNARDALLAEILGDVDTLLNKVSTATKELDNVRDSVQNLGNDVSSEYLKNIEAAHKNFDSAVIGRIDDFVNVANETLVRFNSKTQELREEIIKANVSKPATSQPVISSASEGKSRVDAFSFILGAVVFLGGALVGLLLK